jgi:S1-C subfamily serine protease
MWFRKAATQGDAVSQSNLGDLYHLGRGVEQNDIEAIAWYEKAADQGGSYAKEMMARAAEGLSSTASRENSNVSSQVRETLSPQAIAKIASQSTVLIVSVNQAGKNGLLGSGFAIGSNLIITNSHVFPVGRIGLIRQIGTGIPIYIDRVVARDKENDLVLLLVPSIDLPALQLQPSEPAIGDTVFTMGNPEGMEGTFTEGLVSAMRDFRELYT